MNYPVPSWFSCVPHAPIKNHWDKWLDFDQGILPTGLFTPELQQQYRNTQTNALYNLDPVLEPWIHAIRLQ